jgi:hypothetical protein
LRVTANNPSDRTQFLVSRPIQGIARFRSHESELVLSDVYWRWIVEALSDMSDGGELLPFVEAVEEGFRDAANLVETIPVTPKFLQLLRRVAPSRAPSFERVDPSEGGTVPTAERILAELTRLVGEALSSGTMVMEIE